MRHVLPLALGLACTPAAPDSVCALPVVASTAPTLPVRPFAQGEVSTVRLVDEDWSARGPQRAQRPELASWSASELAAWRAREGDTVVYTSPILLGQEVPHVARLTVAPGSAAWMDVLPSPLQVATDTERSLRTLRIPLVPGRSGHVEVDVPIATVLGENWGDERGSPVLARLVITLPDSSTPAQLLGVRFVRSPAYTGQAPVVSGVVDALGVRRPGWTLHPGGRVELPAREQADELRLYAAAEHPGVLQVWADNIRLADVPVGDAWQAGAWPVPSDAVVSLHNPGETPILVGEPRRVGSLGDRPNVLAYMIDTLRADHVGALSDGGTHTTPTLDRLAGEGALFARAQSTGSWTKPTVPTLLTGRYPMAHGVGLRGYADVLPEHIPMVHEALAAHGWRVGSFSASPLGSTLSGLDRGFDVSVPPVHWRGALGALGHPTAQQTGAALLEWVDAAPDEPWMAYVHTLEPHAWRNEGFRSPPDGRTPYQAAVTAADDGLAELLSALDTRGELDSTVVVVVSDHGESFGLHGAVDHGTSTHQAQVHVPLIFWAPQHVTPSVTTDTVSLADVTPTLLDILGVPPLPDMDGVSLVPYLSGTVSTPLRPGAPSTRLRFVSEPGGPAWYAWTASDGHKVTQQSSAVFTSDLGVDPCEMELSSGGSDDVSSLREWRVQAQRQLAPSTPAPASSEDTELLRALGYVP